MRTLTQIKDHWREQRLFTSRIIMCVIMALALIGIVVARLIQLQVADSDYYSAQSQGNRIRVQPLPPTRGLIFDRGGRVLAENLPTWQLELTPEQVPDLEETLRKLVAIGLLEEEKLGSIREMIARKRRFDSIPILQRMDDEAVARFAVQRPYFPGVEIRARLLRHYPFGPSAAHALGYVGGISVTDQGELDPSEYAGTSYIGKVSIERAYEQELHGRVGHADVVVNAHGRAMETLDSKASNPGSDLMLTLDVELQMIAERALEGRRGAVVAIEPGSGEILVFASAPSFDPNLFIAGLTPDEFRALQQDPDQPLFNRALRGAYPPGSTIKPMLALAGITERIIDPNKTRYCRGYFTLPGHSHRYRDWKPEGHGFVNMHDAIAQSCDTYFYELANQMGIDTISTALRSFGLGTTTGVDIRGEARGLVPSREWKKTAFTEPGDQVWFPGETVITGIGQGYLLTTPLQLAQATATIAARGVRHRPSLVRALRDSATGEITRAEPSEATAAVEANESDWDRIIAAMRGVMSDRSGTARFVGRESPWKIAGKSGTAQVITVAQDETYDEEELAERMRDHALFVAFAPVDDPAIAVAVIVENGGSGSGVAAPVARQVIDTWLGKKRP